MAANFSEDEKYTIDIAGDAQASHTYPTQASALRKGGYAILKGKPCKLLSITTAKPGKHGHAKCNITGKDVFTDATVEDMCPSSHNMEVPFVKKVEYDLMYVSKDGFLSLLTSEGNVKADVKAPGGELGEKIEGMLEEEKTVVVIILAAMGKEIVVDAKAIAED